MTDFRALCAELAQQLDDALDYTVSSDTRRHMKALTARARAELAEGEKGPSDVELEQLAVSFSDEVGDGYGSMVSDEVGYARAVLARYGTTPPRPIPVSERLPGAEDCQDEGWAWYFNPRIGWRQAVLPVSPSFTHWLPAHALPIPTQENTDD